MFAKVNYGDNSPRGYATAFAEHIRLVKEEKEKEKDVTKKKIDDNIRALITQHKFADAAILVSPSGTLVDTVQNITESIEGVDEITHTTVIKDYVTQVLNAGDSIKGYMTGVLDGVDEHSVIAKFLDAFKVYINTQLVTSHYHKLISISQQQRISVIDWEFFGHAPRNVTDSENRLLLKNIVDPVQQSINSMTERMNAMKKITKCVKKRDSQIDAAQLNQKRLIAAEPRGDYYPDLLYEFPDLDNTQAEITLYIETLGISGDLMDEKLTTVLSDVMVKHVPTSFWHITTETLDKINGLILLAIRMSQSDIVWRRLSINVDIADEATWHTETEVVHALDKMAKLIEPFDIEKKYTITFNSEITPPYSSNNVIHKAVGATIKKLGVLRIESIKFMTDTKTTYVKHQSKIDKYLTTPSDELPSSVLSNIKKVDKEMDEWKVLEYISKYRAKDCSLAQIEVKRLDKKHRKDFSLLAKTWAIVLSNGTELKKAIRDALVNACKNNIKEIMKTTVKDMVNLVITNHKKTRIGREYEQWEVMVMEDMELDRNVLVSQTNGLEDMLDELRKKDSYGIIEREIPNLLRKGISDGICLVDLKQGGRHASLHSSYVDCVLQTLTPGFVATSPKSITDPGNLKFIQHMIKQLFSINKRLYIPVKEKNGISLCMAFNKYCKEDEYPMQEIVTSNTGVYNMREQVKATQTVEVFMQMADLLEKNITINMADIEKVLAGTFFDDLTYTLLRKEPDNLVYMKPMITKFNPTIYPSLLSSKLVEGGRSIGEILTNATAVTFKSKRETQEKAHVKEVPLNNEFYNTITDYEEDDELAFNVSPYNMK